MSEVVALLLDDAMPAERLGALLRAARKRRGLSRKQASAIVGITPVKLRRYERGDKQVPAEVCARLAECYGDDLTAHVPLRVPPEIGDREIAVDGVQRTVGPDVDDVVAGFVDIVQRLRDAKPGEPLALRASDVIALAGALGRDPEEIERRIADALGCSPTLARTLHTELLRRKVILPVAGLAAGVAALHDADPGIRRPDRDVDHRHDRDHGAPPDDDHTPGDDLDHGQARADHDNGARDDGARDDARDGAIGRSHRPADDGAAPHRRDGPARPTGRRRPGLAGTAAARSERHAGVDPSRRDADHHHRHRRPRPRHALNPFIRL
jgi:transcriptional regulator with XRE-family HTH domain